MKILDVKDPSRIKKTPDRSIILLSSGKFVERGFEVKNIYLNLYLQEKDQELGQYSLLTVCVETNKGTIEMTYDEGYRGEHALEEAAAFLTSHLGLSGIILRSILELEAALRQPA